MTHIIRMIHMCDTYVYTKSTYQNVTNSIYPKITNWIFRAKEVQRRDKFLLSDES